MDMSPAYVKGATEHFPQARIVFDKFHLMVLAGQALDEVRRELGRDGGSDLRRALELTRQRLEPERGASRAT
jgi:transposase